MIESCAQRSPRHDSRYPAPTKYVYSIIFYSNRIRTRHFKSPLTKLARWCALWPGPWLIWVNIVVFIIGAALRALYWEGWYYDTLIWQGYVGLSLCSSAAQQRAAPITGSPSWPSYMSYTLANKGHCFYANLTTTWLYTAKYARVIFVSLGSVSSSWLKQEKGIIWWT